MYKILLVDDEPIILSGIKFLIDWEKNGCTVVGTARNGQEALDKIRGLRPHIVVCDINMPVMNGLDLVKTVSAENPGVVFIMLTNHQEFDLARDALRLRAVDYLLKSHLEPAAMERSLALACEVVETRSKLARVEQVDDYLSTNRQQLLRDSLLRVVQAPAEGGTDPVLLDVLTGEGVLEGYAVAQILLDFTEVPGLDGFTAEDFARLFHWEKEVAEKLAGNFFEKYALLAPDRLQESLLLFCWDITSSAWEEKSAAFYAKLCSASANVTCIVPAMLSTGLLYGAQSIHECGGRLLHLRDNYYSTGQQHIRYGEMPPLQYASLGLGGFCGRLVGELRSKNSTACAALLDKAIRQVQEVCHQKSQAVWLCSELYAALCEEWEVLSGGEETDGGFFDKSRGNRRIEHLATREQVVRWLVTLKNELIHVLEQLTAGGGKSELMDKVCHYVRENVESRIMLQDVADYICISPGYLSALFKKEVNQNFIDFVNQTKMERACELIRGGQLRMNEISDKLGFENAYYFSKVFRKHMGMTPTEYRIKSKHPSEAKE